MVGSVSHNRPPVKLTGGLRIKLECDFPVSKVNHGPAQVSLAQVGLAQVGPAQVGPAQVGLAQVGLAQVVGVFFAINKSRHGLERITQLTPCQLVRDRGSEVRGSGVIDRFIECRYDGCKLLRGIALWTFGHFVKVAKCKCSLCSLFSVFLKSSRQGIRGQFFGSLLTDIHYFLHWGWQGEPGSWSPRPGCLPLTPTR